MPGKASLPLFDFASLVGHLLQDRLILLAISFIFQIGRLLRVEIRMLPLVDGGMSDLPEPTEGF